MSEPGTDFSFAVLSIYTSAPEHRQRFLSLMEDFATAQARSLEGLCSFETFTDESQSQIVTLARWKNREAFEAFKHSEVGLRASEIARVLTPKVFFLRPEGVVTSTVAPPELTGTTR